MSRIRFLLIWFGVILTAVTLVSLVYWDGTAQEVGRIAAVHRSMEPWWEWVARVRASDGLFLILTVIGILIALRWAPRGPGERSGHTIRQIMRDAERHVDTQHHGTSSE